MLSFLTLALEDSPTVFNEWQGGREEQAVLEKSQVGHVNHNCSIPLFTPFPKRKARSLDVLLSFKKWLIREEADFAEGLPSADWLVGGSVGCSCD